MREARADLWALHRAGAAIVVTVDGGRLADGRAHLGVGLGRAAQARFPWLAAALGARLATDGNHVFHVGERIITFPVEHGPFERPDLALVARSAGELAALADREGFSEVALPRPGCGLGGLEWRDVEPLLAARLDDRFVVVTRP